MRVKVDFRAIVKGRVWIDIDEKSETLKAVERWLEGRILEGVELVEAYDIEEVIPDE